MGTQWTTNWSEAPGSRVCPPLYSSFLPPEQHNLTTATLSYETPPLVHVLYPGHVIDPDKALLTLGGTAGISNAFSNNKRKLELHFRPRDVYSNCVNGEGTTTCGILIRIRRRRKNPPDPPVNKDPPVLMGYAGPDEPQLKEPIEKMSAYERRRLPFGFEHSRFIRTTATGEEFEVIKGEENIVDDPGEPLLSAYCVPPPDEEEDDPSRLLMACPNNSDKYISRNMMLHEESFLLEEMDQKLLEQSCDRPTVRTGMEKERIYLEVPPKINVDHPPISDLAIQPLGVIHRQYKFTGLCDYQYLPTKKSLRGRQVSIRRRIAPVFADPDSINPRKSLFACDFKAKGHGTNVPAFLVPAVMSRLDKPIPSTESFMEESRSVRESGVRPERHLIKSTRPRRIVYSHMCNFRVTDSQVKDPLLSKLLVPEEALKDALVEAEKRGLSVEPLDKMRGAFATRPVWTKQALEFHLGLSKYVLKYTLPCCAYFALNGPWRSCWIRLGYDPRFHKTAFRYQLLDYRVPGAYRGFLPKENDLASVGELTFSFRPGVIPPKSQMFYQFCEIHIPEVEELTVALNLRVEKDRGMDFGPALGFLDEDMAEFCRYAISRYVEMHLRDMGKIPTVTLCEIRLLPGGIVPCRPYNKGPIGRKHHRMRPGKFRGLPLPSEDILEHGLMDDGEDTSSQDMADLSIDPDQKETEDETESEDDILDEDDPILQQILRITREEREKAEAEALGKSTG